MADHESLIEQFVGVTGTEASRARFYLESAAWDVELAISTFFEGGENNENSVDRAEDFEDVSMPTDSTAQQATDSSSKNRVQTFSNMYVDPDSSDEEGQAYYAGGSDRSGQQVLGPPKKKDANKLVESLFKSAREHGAEEKREEDQPSISNRPTFVGAGYRLGETPEDTQVVAGHSRPAPQQQVDKKLKLWKNGFSVDDGPLRDFNSPENKQFLDSIARGEVPQELIREAHGGEVNLDMEDHRAEEYVKPKVKVKAFSGAGHMLGSEEPNSFSPTPNVVSANPPAGDRSAPTIVVDDKKPTTNVQLRLADGKRLVLKLNHSHRVSDIRQHIVTSNPQYAQSNFSLMTTFPNKELTDETQTIEEAKLINAVVVQRMK
ncbi:nsfl1 cofactor p47 [Plakobranchus ocellatus]|uniref:Nsfl1 cofactor p47 n=1 Tax=Plakobranchus ocellatus TaxID=259542 RepID=A0AAV4BSV8_9GAST|nr:nsfl1 cofactor p47 [Plakobranchus ocellatus]